jgi:hypothetical protein
LVQYFYASESGGELRELQDDPMWFEISDTQAQTLIQAAER